MAKLAESGPHIARNHRRRRRFKPTVELEGSATGQQQMLADA